jgi:hypothetical protein
LALLSNGGLNPTLDSEVGFLCDEIKVAVCMEEDETMFLGR